MHKDADAEKTLLECFFAWFAMAILLWSPLSAALVAHDLLVFRRKSIPALIERPKVASEV
jgi:hypothetical protein